MNGAAGKYLFKDLADHPDVRRGIKSAWGAKHRQARLASESSQAATRTADNAPTRSAPALQRDAMRC